jgi:Ca2+-binding RTX toxin-like protein
MEQIGAITKLEGRAVAVSESGERVLSEGSPVYKGETVSTEAESSLAITFSDDSVLSQGADSTISLDEYVYNLEDPASSKAVFNITKGVFRMVTGEIVEAGVEDVSVQTPLSVIGIRGTTTVHQVLANLEKHGVESITIGSQVTVTDAFGNTRTIDLPEHMVEVFQDRPSIDARPFTPEERELFDRITFEDVDEPGDEDEGGEEQAGEQTDAGDEEPPDEEQDQDQQDTGDDTAETGEEQEEPPGDVTEQAEQFLFNLFGVESWTEFSDFIQNILAEPEPFESPEEEDDDDTAAADEDGEEETSSNAITGTSNPDTLVGGSGNDEIYGLCGDDSLVGGAGNDSFHGGDGNDTMDGGAGSDWIFLEHSSADLESNDTLIPEGDASDGGFTDFLRSIENIQGSSSANYLGGSDYANIMKGMAGNDELFGDEGNDTLFGGDGMDTLQGESGSDYLYGEAGQDTLSYIFPSEGGDTVGDFDSGTDVFLFRSGNFGNIADGTLPSANFASGNYNGYQAGEAGLSNPGFVYDQDMDQLWYDDNSGGATLIADVEGEDVIRTDIEIEGV